MNEGEIRMQAEMLAIQAEISAKIIEAEGMKAENSYRLSNENSIAYGDEHFFNVSKEIMTLRDRLLNEI